MTHMVRHHGMTKPGGPRSELEIITLPRLGAMRSAYEPVRAHRVLCQDTGSAVELVPTAVMGKCHRAWLRFGSPLHRNTSKGLRRASHAAATESRALLSFGAALKQT